MSDGLPPGFEGFDDFEEDDLPKAVEAFYALKRGDVFELSKHKWRVFQKRDDHTALVYKHPTKGRKMYQAALVDTAIGEVEVFQIDGTGKRVGSLVDAGRLVRDNPFRSKAQRRKFYAMEARGEIPKGTSARWERHTPKSIWLPERVNPEEAGCILPMSLVEADILLKHPEDVVALISIGDVDSEEPDFVEATGVPALRIEFDDEWDFRKKAAPDKGDVKTIIDFLNEVLPSVDDDNCLVIHCNMGWSRSTASALIAWAMLLGKGREKEAMANLLDSRSIAMPNRLMVEYADDLLGHKGRLIDVNEKRHGDAS